MKRLFIAALAIGSLATAQDKPVVNEVRFQPSSVMGKVINGAPYSAEEITESLQVLADGTRIARQNQVTVYRDGEGRVRRETPTSITIFDPVANVNYRLDPKAMTATKNTMGYFRQDFTFAPRPNGPATVSTVDPADPRVADMARAARVMLDKLQTELKAQQAGAMVVDGSPADAQMADLVKTQLAHAEYQLVTPGGAANTESLGQRVIEGVTTVGTRTTLTIETGAIGNDRPIQVVTERWISPELQTPVMTKRTDPRSGEETFRLANVHRGEPGADLFAVPPGYQIVDSPKIMPVVKKKEE